MKNKILIVDDSEMQRALQKGILVDQGVDAGNIFEAHDGQKALDYVNAGHEVSLIISDWNMPRMSGIEFITELRKINENVPVLMVTSESDEEKLVKAYEAGANGFLNKPVEPAALKEAISALQG